MAMLLSQTCKSSGKVFEVRDEDLAFYDKISPVWDGKKYLIPSPTLHPKERERRRLAFRNERVLYHRKSDLSGKEIISFFHPDAPFKVFSQDEWWGDQWDSMEYGHSFDFGRPFFEQFYELELAVPRPPLVNNKAYNSDFCNFADGNKNCYLITSANWNEDCYYGFCMVSDKNAVDCLWCTDSELLYECVDCRKCYNLRHAQNCDNCADSAFLLNCKSVSDSIFCVNLRNKKHYIFNQQATKEQVEKMMAEMKGGYAKYQEMLKKFEELKRQYPVREANNFISCENVTGNNIFNSQNVHKGFDVYESKDCAYLHDGLRAKDCYDVCFFDGTELCYESTSLIGYGFRFTNFCRDSHNLFYCDNCHSCKNCFGCVGLRHKEYCIFNRQYTQDEYDRMAGRIAARMVENGEWGEFFPIKYSLFAYNETLAQDYFPMEKKDALAKGYPWRDETTTPVKVDKVIDDPAKLPDNISQIPNDVLNWAIKCEVSGKPFKIQSAELEFYRKMDLPLPRKHPDVRLADRLKLRTGHKLWDRKCDKCGNDIKTPYAPERAEKVFCEKCYLEAVY